MKQELSTLYERQLWGRFVDGYQQASGTGSRLTDPQAKEIYADGALFLMMRLEPYEIRDLFKSHVVAAMELETALKETTIAKPMLQLKGLKINRGFLRGSVWVGFVSALVGGRQFNMGWLAGKDIQMLFNVFDAWIVGKQKALNDVAAAAKSA